MHIPD